MVGGTRRVCFFGKDRQRAARVVSELSDVPEITLVSVVRPLGAVQAVFDRFQSAQSRTMQADFRRS